MTFQSESRWAFLLPVSLESAGVRVGPVGRQDGPCREAGRRWVLAALRDGSEEAEGPESATRSALGLGILRHGVRETLASAVHGGPEAVVVAVALAPSGEVFRALEVDLIDEAVRRAAVAAVDLLLEAAGFLGQRVTDTRD
jgi:hypothetical protein